MKTQRKTTAFAIALLGAATLSAPASHALDVAAVQLEQNLQNELMDLGIDSAMVANASEAQLAEIRTVLESDKSADQKRQEIRAILAAAQQMPADAAANTQGMGLEASVRGDLEQLGVRYDDIGGLTMSQVARIRTVLESDRSEELKRQEIDKILGPQEGADAEALTANAAGQQLEAEVRRDLDLLGIRYENIAGLTVQQVTRIRQIVEGDLPMTEKVANAKAALGV